VRSFPGIVQLTGAAAMVLIGGSLAPWIDYGSGPGFGGSGDYASGVSFNSGELAVLIGALTIFLLSRMVREQRQRDSGGIAALGLLAGALVAIVAIRYHGDQYNVEWGLYVSAGAALMLLIAGLLLLDIQDKAPDS
jgi:hypothetical protein